MGALDDYVQKVGKELVEKNITDELEIVRYIYLDLGSKLSFDPKYLPFGKSKYRHNLYKYQSHGYYNLNECLRTHTAICKSISNILKHVIEKFNIKIEVCTDLNDKRKNKHIYNVVFLSNGKIFIIDLQEDIRNIQMNYFTTDFGLDVSKPENYIISREEIEKIDKKFGYITKDKPYSDEYLDFLHLQADGIEDFMDKVDIILENIDLYVTKHMGYTDRQWNHRRVLKEFFNEKEFNYDGLVPGKIRFIDCHINEDENIKYVALVQVIDGKRFVHYIYNEDLYKYEKITLDQLAKLYDNGLIVHKNTIHGLGEYLRTRKNK